MKRFFALLCVVTVAGCGWFSVAEPLPPEAPPKTHVAKPAPKQEKVADKVETLHFFASWCGPCRMQKPLVESLKHDFDITDDDVDDKDSRGNEFGITSVPNYIVLVNGEKKYQTQSAMALGIWLRSHVDVRPVQKSQGQVRNLSQSS